MTEDDDAVNRLRDALEEIKRRCERSIRVCNDIGGDHNEGEADAFAVVIQWCDAALSGKNMSPPQIQVKPSERYD